MSADQTFQEVQLAVYDLSRGMARSLSIQFLGPNHAIDIIPHTGIVAFGKEYYFGGTGPGVDTNIATGGGITMSSSPFQFRASYGIQPIQVISLGCTKVSKQEFESWCQSMMNNGSYAGYNYNLIERNCNNFSHDAALKGLKLKNGVPDWILNVPHRFISSPMGQMVRPMLEQMQITGPSSGDVGGLQGGADSIGNNQGFNNNNNNGSMTGDADYNPWAGMSASTHQTISKKIGQLNTPILDSHNQPLLSNDSNVVQICVQKLKQSNCFDDIKMPMTEPGNQQNNSHHRILDDVGHLLSNLNTRSQHKNEEDEQRQLREQEITDILSSTSSLFLSLFDPEHLEQRQQQQEKRYSSEKLYTLMLLRLIILQPLLKEEMYQRILENMSRFISMIENDDSTTNNYRLEKRKFSLRSMSWCVISNGLGKHYITSKIPYNSENKGINILQDSDFVQNLVDLAIIDISRVGGESVETRRCATAFLYNFILFMSSKVQDVSNISNDNDAPDIPDVIVTILCGVAEGLTEDKDSLCLMRRLLVIGNILITKKPGDKDVKKTNTNVASLLADIGYLETLETLISLTAENAKKVSETHLLAEEIVKVINVVV